MNWASKNGHLDVVKYLHSKNKDCTVWWASSNGHIEVVKYLHSINKDCTESAMDWASSNCHLEVVKYLHSISFSAYIILLYEAIHPNVQKIHLTINQLNF